MINNSKDAFIQNDIQNRQITIEVVQNINNIEIIFKDNAGGIPQEIINEIFKVNFTTKDNDKGTGIGLYLVTQILEKINGKIEVKNIYFEAQKGVEFKIILPL